MSEPRPMPFSMDAEKGALGAALVSDHDGLATFCEMLNDDDFYVPAHRIISRAMRGMVDAGSPIDYISFKSALEDAGTLDRAGGEVGLFELFDYVPTAANLIFYAEIVRAKANFRRLIATASEAVRRAYDEQEEPVAEHVAKLEQALQDIDPATPHHRGPVHISKAVMDALDELDVAHDDEAKLPGVLTGIGALDDKILGWQPGEHVIIAGHPGDGKTAFGVQVMINNALGPDPVHWLMFSMEMPKGVIAFRAACQIAKLDFIKARSGKLTRHEQARCGSALNRLLKAPIHIDERHGLSLAQVRSAIRNSVRERGTRVVVIDYIQLMRAPRSGRDTSNAAQELAETANGLKSVAREFGITVISLAQLKRNAKGEENKRPNVNEIKGGSGPEESADLVGMLWRPDKGREGSLQEDGILVLGKHRGGALADVKMDFYPPSMRFADQHYDG